LSETARTSPLSVTASGSEESKARAMSSVGKMLEWFLHTHRGRIALILTIIIPLGPDGCDI